MDQMLPVCCLVQWFLTLSDESVLCIGRELLYTFVQIQTLRSCLFKGLFSGLCSLLIRFFSMFTHELYVRGFAAVHVQVVMFCIV